MSSGFELHYRIRKARGRASSSGLCFDSQSRDQSWEDGPGGLSRLCSHLNAARDFLEVLTNIMRNDAHLALGQ